MLLNISEVCSFLKKLVSVIPLYGYTTSFRHLLLMNILVDKYFSYICLKAIMSEILWTYTCMHVFMWPVPHLGLVWCFLWLDSNFQLLEVITFTHLSYISNVNFNHSVKCFPISPMYNYYTHKQSLRTYFKAMILFLIKTSPLI